MTKLAKGPVMDRLARTHFLGELSGKVFLNHYDAILELDSDCTGYAFPSREALL